MSGRGGFVGVNINGGKEETEKKKIVDDNTNDQTTVVDDQNNETTVVDNQKKETNVVDNQKKETNVVDDQNNETTVVNDQNNEANVVNDPNNEDKEYTKILEDTDTVDLTEDIKKIKGNSEPEDNTNNNNQENAGNQNNGNNQNNDGNGNNQNNTRSEALKTELVDHYLTAKKNEHDRFNDLPERQEGEGKNWKKKAGAIVKTATSKAKTATKGLGYVNDVLNTAVGFGNSLVAAKDVHDKGGLLKNSEDESESDTDTTSDTDTSTDDGKKDRQYVKGATTIGAGLSAVSGGITSLLGMGMNGVGTFSHNKRTKWNSFLGLGSSTLGLLANASKLTSIGASFGDQDNKTVSGIKGWSGVAGAGFGALAGAINTVSSFGDWNYRRKIINDSKKTASSTDTDNAQEAAQKTTVKTAKQNNNKDQYRLEKKKMNSLKAKKYALKQAANMNEAKKSQIWKGFPSLIGSTYALASSFTGVFEGFGNSVAGKLLKMSSGLVSSLSTIAKQTERFSDHRAEKKIAVKKVETVNEYITKKTPGLNEDITNFMNAHANYQPITENEKKRIIIGRLGVDIGIEDKEPSTEDYDKAFAAITHKRAMNIMNSEDAVKKEVLETLRLTESATVEDVEAVLRGD